MRTVEWLLNQPGMAYLMALVSPQGGRRVVDGLLLVEELHDIPERATGRLVVFTSHASARLTGHQLDILVRLAAGAEAAGVAVHADALPRGLPQTTRVLAGRAGLAVLSIPPGTNTGELLLRLHDLLTDGWAEMLERCRKADLALAGHAFETRPVAEVAELLTAELGVKVTTAAAPGSSIGTPVVVDGRTEATLSHPATLPTQDLLVRLLVNRAAYAAAVEVAATRRAVDIPAASRASLLGELLSSGTDQPGPLLARARQSGIPVDAWHSVVHLEPANLGQLFPGDEVAQFDFLLEAQRLALQSATANEGTWHRADAGSSLTLIRSDRAVPAATISRVMAEASTAVIERLQTQYPRVHFHCGVGGTYQGLEGLRTSANEARAGAEAARSARRTDQPVIFNSLGFRRSLLQWYSLGGTRLMVDRLLAPLEDLGPSRREEALRTLQAYLAHPTSMADAASSLGVHRNTLTNRVKRLFELLDLDETNADHRLLLQLACRLRAL